MNNQNEQTPLSREALRKQREAEFEERDKKRLAVEKEYAKNHKKNKPIKKSRQEINEKTNRLKHKLNVALLIVFSLIILVYLILFFL